MNKKYLVLYHAKAGVSVYHAAREWEPNGTDGYDTSYLDVLAMQVFTDEQEAADFAAKNDGFIVVPAQITSKVSEQ